MSIMLDVFAKLVSLWGQHRLVVMLVLLGILAVAVMNSFHLRRLGDLRPSGSAAPVSSAVPAEWPMISVLVPARNEEGNIGACLSSLVGQEYPHFEILVLDDESSDGTAAVVAGFASDDERVRLIRGRPLPGGWLGKHWACHQLAAQASGELLLFTDADTRHRPTMLRDAALSQYVEDSDLLTALPRELVGSWAERLVLPVIAWALLALLPLPVAHRSRTPLLSGAIGQFMLFRRSAYAAVGGHATVRMDVVDDMALARVVKAEGLRWRLLDGSRHVECRMYATAKGVIDGLGKCIFPALHYRLWAMLALFAVLGLAFLVPAGVLLLSFLGAGTETGAMRWAAMAAVVALIPWIMACARFKIPLYLALLYPVTVAAVILIGVRSAVLTMQGRLTWKDRVLAGERADS